MWSSNTLGEATFREGDFDLNVDATPDSKGIAMRFPAGLSVRVTSVQPETFPAIGEQFVCDDQYHAQFPQRDAAYAVRFACDRIESDTSVRIFEVRLSIQTARMEGEPALNFVTHAEGAIVDSAEEGVAWRLERSGHRLALLLCTEDLAAFARIDATTTRCFGGFLEKGVIRRVRPWLVYAPPGSDGSLSELRQRLEESPIPLSA